MSNFTQRLAQLSGMKCEVVHAIDYEEPADAIYSVGTSIEFTESTKLQAQFWRLKKKDRPLVSIFNFTAFEIWAVTFPDGAMELSNYALSEPERVQFRPQ